MGVWHVYFLPTLLCAAGLCFSYSFGQEEDFKMRYERYFATGEDGSTNKLISDLHGILEKLKNNRLPSYGKKHSYLRLCDPGDLCAMRKGSRIGKLCDCSLPRTCNSFLHRCL